MGEKQCPCELSCSIRYVFDLAVASPMLIIGVYWKGPLFWRNVVLLYILIFQLYYIHNSCIHNSYHILISQLYPIILILYPILCLLKPSGATKPGLEGPPDRRCSKRVSRGRSNGSHRRVAPAAKPCWNMLIFWNVRPQTPLNWWFVMVHKPHEYYSEVLFQA